MDPELALTAQVSRQLIGLRFVIGVPQREALISDLRRALGVARPHKLRLVRFIAGVTMVVCVKNGQAALAIVISGQRVETGNGAIALKAVVFLRDGSCRFGDRGTLCRGIELGRLEDQLLRRAGNLTDTL